MKIVVLGNCQAASYRRLFAAIIPGADVKAFTPSMRVLPAMASAVRDADHVFAQSFSREVQTKLYEQSGVPHENFHLLPKVAFTGYHPDSIYFHRLTAKNTGLPTSYNSAIATAGYLSGRTVEETLELYNTYIFAAAGYFDRFAEAVAALEEHFRSVGFESLAGRIDHWHSRGAFMYTINHPRIDVLFDIALTAAQKSDLPIASGTPAKMKDQFALATRWPIYPQIAERLGVDGSLRLERRLAEKNLDMDWQAYLRTCFAIYPSLPQKAMRTPDVDAILSLID